MDGYRHGPTKCDRCWANNDKVQCAGNFNMVRDPGYWGSSNPETLVLGVSKGNTQARAYEVGKFDDVAFKGVRPRALSVLQSIGLLVGETPGTFERRFTSFERDFGFASIVRCSLTAAKDNGSYTAAMPEVGRAFASTSEANPWVMACIEQHLTVLPARTKLVILFGNADQYVRRVRDAICVSRGEVHALNAVAYRSRGVTFVHVGHPSEGNGHYGHFVRGEGTSGTKRDLARAVVWQLRGSDQLETLETMSS